MWALGFGWLSAQGPGALESTFFEGRTHPAIAYDLRPADDAVARLDRALEAGEAKLEFEPGSGYLRSLLRTLQIDPDTQLAVFSKTSLQSHLINPRNPRTIFFNDSAVVAWPRGGFIEIAAQDPSQGVAFYMLEQRQTLVPRFRRERSCLTCHVSYATLNVPGTLVRSVATANDGAALSYLANATVDHRTPFEERWAGWFVTGATAGLRHLGNSMVAAPVPFDASVTPAAVPLVSMASRLDTAGYLSAHSDIAALLVFAHQMHMMNLITRIGWQTRTSLADNAPDAARTLAAAAAEFVDYLLFVDEPRLPAPVKGASGFAERFSGAGPRDRRGRSLRELDLNTRLMKYPCSYLIYSPAFDALPGESKTAIYTRLSAALTGKLNDARYRRLSAADRQAILEILRDTKPDFASYGVAGL
ncbi:MAG TPA: hypothetical protein VGQ37_10160 [Vicinamibacterales bacterium]|jgi:hypothetical protein|nr:hypothetical protein [Vicinamibacterales bacterium]